MSARRCGDRAEGTLPLSLGPRPRRRSGPGVLALALGLVLGVADIRPAVAQAQLPPADPVAPAAAALALPAQARLDAELRFRASRSRQLSDLQAGLDEFRHGVFFRTRLGAAFDHDVLGAYLQLQASGALGDSGPGQAPLPVGLQQGYVRARAPVLPGLQAEVGRLALDFGAGRQIGRYDFHDSGNAFDGLHLRYGARTALDLHAVAVQIRRNSAQPQQERQLAGLYLTGLPAEGLTTDLYFLYLRDGSDEATARVLTMGARIDWRPGRLLHLEAEAAGQVGEQRTDGAAAPVDHAAMMAAGMAAVAFEVGLPVELAAYGHIYSGDGDPNDKVLSRWRPLYPSLDEQVGLLQLVQPSNLGQYGGRVTLRAPARVAVSVDGRVSVSRTGEPLPGFDGMALPGDGSWQTVGTELDFRVEWPWRPGSVFLLAAGAFLPAAALEQALGQQLAGQALLQWTSRF